MKYAVTALLVVHGLITLLGFVKAFDLFPVTQLDARIAVCGPSVVSRSAAARRQRRGTALGGTVVVGARSTRRGLVADLNLRGLE